MLECNYKTSLSPHSNFNQSDFVETHMNHCQEACFFQPWKGTTLNVALNTCDRNHVKNTTEFRASNKACSDSESATVTLDEHFPDLNSPKLDDIETHSISTDLATSSRNIYPSTAFLKEIMNQVKYSENEIIQYHHNHLNSYEAWGIKTETVFPVVSYKSSTKYNFVDKSSNTVGVDSEATVPTCMTNRDQSTNMQDQSCMTSYPSTTKDEKGTISEQNRYSTPSYRERERWVNETNPVIDDSSHYKENSKVLKERQHKNIESVPPFALCSLNENYNYPYDNIFMDTGSFIKLSDDGFSNHQSPLLNYSVARKAVQNHHTFSLQSSDRNNGQASQETNKTYGGYLVSNSEQIPGNELFSSVLLNESNKTYVHNLGDNLFNDIHSVYRNTFESNLENNIQPPVLKDFDTERTSSSNTDISLSPSSANSPPTEIYDCMESAELVEINHSSNNSFSDASASFDEQLQHLENEQNIKVSEFCDVEMDDLREMDINVSDFLKSSDLPTVIKNQINREKRHRSHLKGRYGQRRMKFLQKRLVDLEKEKEELMRHIQILEEATTILRCKIINMMLGKA